jgi:hypothetical protein
MGKKYPFFLLDTNGEFYVSVLACMILSNTGIKRPISMKPDIINYIWPNIAIYWWIDSWFLFLKFRVRFWPGNRQFYFVTVYFLIVIISSTLMLEYTVTRFLPIYVRNLCSC